MLNYEESKDKPVSSMQIFFETNFEEIVSDRELPYLINLQRRYSADQLKTHFKGISPYKINKSSIQESNMKLLDLIMHFKFKPSKSEARRFFASNAFSINGNKLALDPALNFDLLDKPNWMGGEYLVVQFGKKDFYLVQLVDE